MLPYPDLCPICGKPVPSEANLRVLRKYALAAAGVGALAGAVFLPFIGFGFGGVRAGSTAAAWQSALGAVAAGSTFANMQSLGATGLGSLLFGSIGAGIGILTTYATLFGFCAGHNATTD